ncbi:MAG: hypothetical protein WBG30_08825 [Psychrilyobacter sp.]|uniref:hypothetical protein n=1 Tax=Psychrilyobacter sp. TaxID=2586924 RepID=UPI003C743CB3
MKKIFSTIVLMSLLVGCGEKTFEEIQSGVNSKTLINDKIEYMDEIRDDKKYNSEDKEQLQNLYNNLVIKLKKEEEKRKIEAMLPDRDGFKGGVAYSVIEFLKENMVNLDIEYVNGGNTLRLSNGLFFQNVSFKVTNVLGQSIKYNSYFLIKDNGYTSDSVVGILETSSDFFDNYLKKNKIETVEDEIYNYYFGGESVN